LFILFESVILHFRNQKYVQSQTAATVNYIQLYIIKSSVEQLFQSTVLN